MGFWANLFEALRNLLATKQRSALALIGIVIGTGSVVAMISIGGMVQNETLKRFKDMGTDLASIRLRGEGRQGIGLEDLATIDASLADSLDFITPSLKDSATLKVGSEDLYLSMIGTTPVMQSLHRLRLTQGRFLSELDRYRRFCVVGHEVAATFARAAKPLSIGDRLTLKDQIFTVIGILDSSPTGPFGSDLNKAAIMPISTMTRLTTSSISEFEARIHPGRVHREVIGRVSAWFSSRYPGISAEVKTPEQMIAQMQDQMQLLTLMLGAIGSISLIVGGVGVMNIMLVSVTERRREIGVRLAIGARRRDVRAQFLVEAILLALTGGLLGLLFGALAALAIAHFAGWEFLVTANVMLLGFGVSAAIGIFFGFYPAVQASNVDPIVALRS